ncbi:MAG: 50S ribosomal protein L10 [Saprospiraceae bacterium]|nr:50S ribosomal protein L10 [Saprospiraceae bacterium]
MTKTEKSVNIELLKEKFGEMPFFYLTDSSTLTVQQVNKLRRLCFEAGIEMKVVKNTLARKAMESFPESKRFENLYPALKGQTAILFTDKASLPAKLLKDFRKGGATKPEIKAAYIDTDVYFGDDQLDVLANLKSKEDLVGEIIALLQSPAKTVIGSLQSGGTTIMGLLKTLGDREQ